MSHNALIRALRNNLQSALRNGDISQARDLFRQLADEDPLAVETRGLELELLVAEQRWDDAKTLASQLVALFPGSARIHSLAARVDYHRKDYRRARENFEEAERLHPHWMTRLWLGKACTQLGDFDTAEALLLGLVAEHPEAATSLAWLYERRNRPEQAIRQLEGYLATRPHDRFARTQLLRLRAHVAAADDLIDEVEALQELGEEIAPEMLPAYVQRLLESGRGGEARTFVEAQAKTWTPPTAVAVAWVAYRLRAYDVALNLFLATVAAYQHDYKFLSALEAAARQCQRTGEVVAAYRERLATNPSLHGRIKSLLRRLAAERAAQDRS